MLKKIAIAFAFTVGLSACASQWETSYEQLDTAQTANWTVRDVTVVVPETLTTSEENSFTPDYDIVWHGEPLGDRRAQVAQILDEGLTAGSRVLRGNQPVRIVATLQQFHALTPATKRWANTSGVHDIRYTAQVFDARTGAPLTQPQAIAADMPGLVGAQAREEEAKGVTDRQLIVSHLMLVTQNWLGYGEDPRRQFNRMGR